MSVSEDEPAPRGRNEKILVDRPHREDLADYDTIMGTSWDISPCRGQDGVEFVLHVYAIRRGEMVRVATYPPGNWLGVQFSRELR